MTDRVLGTGSFGQVIMAIDCFRQHQVACKIVNLRSLPLREKDFAVRLRREVDLLKDISHVRERFYLRKASLRTSIAQHHTCRALLRNKEHYV